MSKEKKRAVLVMTHGGRRHSSTDGLTLCQVIRSDENGDMYDDDESRVSCTSPMMRGCHTSLLSHSSCTHNSHEDDELFSELLISRLQEDYDDDRTNLVVTKDEDDDNRAIKPPTGATRTTLRLAQPPCYPQGGRRL